jgi:acetyltransferase-like isoleucine patch superfamily enzyme
MEKYEVGKYTNIHAEIALTWDVPSWNTKTKVFERSKLKIGSFCSIASGLIVWMGGNHRMGLITTYPFGHAHTNVFNKTNGKGHPSTNGDVIIGNDVWIGYNVSIMSGVNIGDGTVISSNSVVYNNVKPYSVVGGNPATFWYFRFNEETIKKLLEIKWWDQDDETINEISPILCSGDVDKLFRYFENKK